MASAALRRGLVAFVAAAALVLGIGGVALLLDEGDEPAAEEAPPLVATTQPAATTTTPAPTSPPTTRPGVENGGDQLRGEGTDRTGPVPLPPMGIDAVELDWQVTELPIHEGWLNQLLVVDGQYWAVGVTPDPAHGSETTFVLSSPDGVQWTEASLPETLTAAGPAIFWVTEEGIVAVVDRWDEAAGTPQLRVFTSPDGAAWAESDLSQFVGAGEHMWVAGVAGGGGTIVLAGAREVVPTGDWEPPVVVIEREGLIVEVDDASQSYVITDAASGDLVTHGSLDRLWGGQGEGIALYDPATGETVFRSGWDALERAAAAAYEGASFGAPLTIEIGADGSNLVIDEYSGALTVTDAAGTVRYAGTEDDLWRGPPPTFTDPRGGDVILVVPWDVWEAAYEAAHGGGEIGHAAPVLLSSDDLGTTWVAAEVPVTGDGVFSFTNVVRKPDGFLALGVVEPISHREMPQGSPTVLQSADGVAWTALPTDLGAAGWMYGLTATDEGYLAILGSEYGTRVMTSNDGLSWRTELSEAELALPVGTAWFDHVADGGFGTLVSGSWDAYAEPDPEAIAIPKGERTLTIAGPVYTVTDDATGAVLFEFDESEHPAEDERAGAVDTGFKWGHGGVAMFDGDGLVVFALPHREFEQAMEGSRSEPDVYYRHESFVVSRSGSEWTRVALPDGLGPDTWCAGLLVGDDRVIVAMHSEVIHSEVDVDMQLRILVGTPK